MRKKIILLVIALVVVVGGVIFYREWRAQRALKELVLYGNVDVRQVDISFRIAGQVETLCFEEGELVEKGRLMATLNRTPYTSQYEQALANSLSIKESVENAQILLKRREELIGVEGVSQEDLDNARTNYSTLKANLAASQAALAVAKDNLIYTEAFAPNEGIVLTRIREPGSVVNPTDPVYTLSLTSPIWIRAYVSEPDLGRIAYGMEAEIRTDTENAPTYRGKIGFISPVAEFTPKTVETTQLRTDLVYRLRIYVDHPGCLLKQGMPVTVRISSDSCE
jgi:HlyD family secretion protein